MKDLTKLTVVKLQAELKKRGLETKGKKADLIKRLQDAIGTQGEEFLMSGDELNESHETGEGTDGHDDEAAGDNVSQEVNHADLENDNPPVGDNGHLTDALDHHDGSEAQVLKQDPVPVKEAPHNETREADEPMQSGDGQQNENAEELPSEVNASADEFQVVDEIKAERDEADVNDEQNEEQKEGAEKKDQTDRKRRHSDSHSHERRRSRSRDRRGPGKEFVVPELDRFEIPEGTVALDPFDADLNLVLSPNCFSARPLDSHAGFSAMWGGVRANCGVRAGKACFQVKLGERVNERHADKDETEPYITRVGWSVASDSLQLGEDPLSFGYGGTGKKSVSCQFEDYGEAFGLGDVVTAMVDFESDSEQVRMSFAKNGVDLGVAFEVAKAELSDRPLLPHVFTKNVTIELNFGQQEPAFPWPEGFTPLQSVEDRVMSAPGATEKSSCEMIMMVGLPGAGKSCWAAKHAAAHPDKRYYILGTNLIMDRMKVMGLSRKRNYEGRFQVLIDRATGCLDGMIHAAARRARNYILDQTNVYANARQRKMRPFEGFQRRACVLVPTDEEFKVRCEKRVKEEGKDVPESAVIEMKASFVLPEAGTVFDSVELAEQPLEEASKLVQQYNEEGKRLRPPPQKRRRNDERYRNFRNRNGGGFRRGNDRGRDFRGGHDRRGGPSGRGPPPPFRPRGAMPPPMRDRRGPPAQHHHFAGSPMRGGPPRFGRRDDRPQWDNRQRMDTRDRRGAPKQGAWGAPSYSMPHGNAAAGGGMGYGQWAGQGSWGGGYSGQGSWNNQQAGFQANQYGSGFGQWGTGQQQQWGNWGNPQYGGYR